MPVIGEVKSARELGYKGNGRRIWSACELCGNERWVMRNTNGSPQNKLCVHCFLKTRSRENNHNWKGGRFNTVDGYIRVLSADHPNKDIRGYVLEHRLVMEQTLGRYLLGNEDVHHLNGIKSDNRPENLAVLKHGEHRQLVMPFQKRIRELELAIEKLIDGQGKCQ